MKYKKLLIRGDAFKKDRKIKIIIEIPNEIYLKNYNQNQQLDFIKQTLNKEIEMMDNYRQSGADVYGSMVEIKVIK